jgi:uncharacterized membrane protein
VLDSGRAQSREEAMPQMVYEWLLAIHILTAVIWVGGGVLGQVLVSRLRKDDPVMMVNTALQLEWVGTRVFLPASLVLLLAGIGMVLEGNWGFTTTWVLIGLIGFGVTVVTGAAFLGPQTKKVHALLESKGTDDPEVQSQMARLFVISRIDLVVLLLVVIDMAVKPGT